MINLPCLKHQDYQISFIYIGQEKIELLCEYCLDDFAIEEQNFDFSQLLHIKKASCDPQQILSKLKLDNTIKQFSRLLQKNNDQVISKEFDELEQSIQKIQDQLLKTFGELQKFLENVKELKQKLLHQITEILRLSEFKQIFVPLNNLENINQINIHNQIKQELNKFISQLNQANAKDMQMQIYQTIFQTQCEIEKYELQIDQSLLHEQFQKFEIDIQRVIHMSFPKIQKLKIPESKNLNNQYFEKIASTIQNKAKQQIKEIKLIYCASTDGSEISTLWQHIDLKDNLIFTFKSQSNFVFGGFSPCQWDQKLNSYVKDDSCTSFLFSQTHDQIYPILEDKYQYAIYCRSDQGPTFGGGDLNIGSNFYQGYSTLGHTYKANVPKKSQTYHLAGQSPPTVIESEVFQIVYFE